VVLVAPRNPLNIGAAARAISNFGFRSLRLVTAYRDAVQEARSGVHSSAVLASAREFATVAEAVADCQLVLGTASMDLRERRQPLDRLEDAAVHIHATPGPVAILFGSENHGLSNDALSYCQRLLRIPTRPEHGSMNLGQCVAVCLYELSRRDAALGVDPAARYEARAAHAEVDRLADLVNQALDQSGYAQTLSTAEKVRRLVRRMDLRPHDAQTWQGILRQILWKLRHPDGP
jgi:tRNA/rRNA methyltransferase